MTSKRLDFLNRRRRVLYMRLRGAPMQGIAETLGLSRSQAYYMLNAARKDRLVLEGVEQQLKKEASDV